jgi:hypothetical protein
LSLAAKGISYTTLIRLGVVWGKGKGAYDKGMFGKTWGCHSPNEIKFLYDAFRKRLNTPPFGPFDALTLLIGDKNARIFCMDNRLHVHYTIRPRIDPGQEPTMTEDLLKLYAHDSQQ